MTSVPSHFYFLLWADVPPAWGGAMVSDLEVLIIILAASHLVVNLRSASCRSVLNEANRTNHVQKAELGSIDPQTRPPSPLGWA